MKKVLIIALILFSFSKISFSQTNKFKALFIYNFTKYLDWPSTAVQNEFTINVIGSNELFNELKNISQSKKVGTKPIVITSEAKPVKAEKYHIVYIDQSRSGIIEEIVAQFGNQPTLIITDCRNCLDKKAHINFLVVDNRLGYELNKELIEAIQIKISSELLQLSTKSK